MRTLPRHTESSSGLTHLSSLGGFTSTSPHQQALSPTASLHGSHADLYSPNHLPIQHIRADDKTGLHSRYDMGSKLGKGAFGTVRLVTDKTTREIFACKSIHKRSKNGASIDQIGREVEIMKKIRHRHVVLLREVYETPHKVYIVMEYCNGGELVKKVQKNGSIEETDLKLVIKRLASVIGYLHDLGIVHRDIKPENILLSTQDPSDPYNIKVSDFGLAAFSGGGKLMENVCGTPLYMAPEVVAGLGYSQQCDIWSIGVMMALLLCNYTRAAEHGLRDMIQRGQVDMNHEMWANCPSSAKNLIEKMLQVDPAQRIAAKEILLHPWITGDALESQTVLEMMRSYRAEQRWKKSFFVVIATRRFLAGINQQLVFPPPAPPSRSSSVDPTDLAAQRRGSATGTGSGHATPLSATGKVTSSASPLHPSGASPSGRRTKAGTVPTSTAPHFTPPGMSSSPSLSGQDDGTADGSGTLFLIHAHAAALKTTSEFPTGAHGRNRYHPNQSITISASNSILSPPSDSPHSSSTLHSINVTSPHPSHSPNATSNGYHATPGQSFGPRLRHRNESSSSPSLPISPHDSTDNVTSTPHYTQLPNPSNQITANITILATGGSGHAGQTLLSNQMSALQMMPSAVRRSSLQGTKRRPLAPIPTSPMSNSALHAASHSPPQSTPAVNSAGAASSASGSSNIVGKTGRNRFQSN